MPLNSNNRIQAFHSGIGDFEDLHVSMHEQLPATFSADLYARGLSRSNATMYPTQSLSYEMSAKGFNQLFNDNQSIEYIVRKDPYLTINLVDVNISIEVGDAYSSEIVEQTVESEYMGGTFKISDYGTQVATGNFWYRGYTFEVTEETIVTNLIGGGTSGRFTVVLYEAEKLDSEKVNGTKLLGHAHAIGDCLENIMPIVPEEGTNVVLYPGQLYLLAQGRTSGSGVHYYVQSLDIEHLQTHPRIKSGTWEPTSNNSFRWNEEGTNEHHILNKTTNLDYNLAMPRIGFLFESDIELPEVTTHKADFTEDTITFKGSLEYVGDNNVDFNVNTSLYFKYGESPNVFEEGWIVDASPLSSHSPTEFSYTIPIDDPLKTYYYRSVAINEAGRVLGPLYKISPDGVADVYTGSGTITIDTVGPNDDRKITAFVGSITIDPLEHITLTNANNDIFIPQDIYNDEGDLVQEATIPYKKITDNGMGYEIDQDMYDSVNCFMEFANQGDGAASFQRSSVDSTSPIYEDLIVVNLNILGVTYEITDPIIVEGLSPDLPVIHPMPTFSNLRDGEYRLYKTGGLGNAQASFSDSPKTTLTMNDPPITTDPNVQIHLAAIEEESEQFEWNSMPIVGTLLVNQDNKLSPTIRTVPISLLQIPDGITDITVTLAATGYYSFDNIGDESKANLALYNESDSYTLHFPTSEDANAYSTHIYGESSYSTLIPYSDVTQIHIATLHDMLRPAEEKQIYSFDKAAYDNSFLGHPSFFFASNNPRIRLRLSEEDSQHVLYASLPEGVLHEWHPSVHNGYYYFNQEEHHFYTMPITLSNQNTISKQIDLPIKPQQGSPIIVEKSGSLYRRTIFYDVNQNPSLVYRMTKNASGTNKIYVDHNDIQNVVVKQGDTTLSNYTVHEHWLEFDSICTGIYQIEYILNNSYMLLEDGDQICLEFWSDEEGISIVYEGSGDTSYKVIPSIGLNNMFSPINKGFIYVTDAILPVHSLSLIVSPDEASLEYNHPVRYIVKAKDKNGNPVPKAIVSCTLGSTTHNLITDQYGFASGQFTSFGTSGLKTIKATCGSTENEQTVMIY